MSAYPAADLAQTSAAAEAIERGNIYQREALWSMTTGEEIAKARQLKLDAWSDDGIFKTVGKAALEINGLYDAGPRSGTTAISTMAGDILPFNSASLPAVSDRMGREFATSRLGMTPFVQRDGAGRIASNIDNESSSATLRLVQNLFYGSIGDPSFIPDDNMIARYGVDNQGVLFDEDTLIGLSKARSEFEIAHLRAYALHARDRERRMGRFSLPVQFAMGLAEGFTDPVMFLSGAAAGAGAGAIGGAVLRTSSGTLARMAEGGLVARTTSGFVAKSTAKGLVPGVGFKATLAAGENIAQGAAIAGVLEDDYSWRQAAIDASLGTGFSVFGSAYSKVARTHERAMVAEAGLTTTPKADYYFAEVPGHRPNATPGDLARADGEAARLLSEGKEPALPRQAYISGRRVRLEDGRTGIVVGYTESYARAAGDPRPSDPAQVLVEVDGKVEAHGTESVSLNRDAVPAIGNKVRIADGTIGVVDRIEGDSLIIKSVVGKKPVETRVPAWLIDQNKGPISTLHGQTAVFNDGRVVQAFLKSRDMRAIADETGHLARTTVRDIDPAGADQLNDFYGEANDTWSAANEERFARHWQTYLSEGKAPTPELTGVFEQFKKWLTDIWNGLVGHSPEQLTPELRAIMGKLLGADADPAKAGTFDRAGPNYKRVRDEIIKTLGKDGKHTPESSAHLAIVTANAKAWARAKGVSLDEFFARKLVGVQGEAIAPDHFARRLIGPTARILITPDRRFDWIQRVIDGTLPETMLNRGQWAELRRRGVETPGMKAWKAERERRIELNTRGARERAAAAEKQAVITAEVERLDAIKQAKIDETLAQKPSLPEQHAWRIAANRIQVEDPNSLGQPLSPEDHTVIVTELGFAKINPASQSIRIVEGMNGHARINGAVLEISPMLARLQPQQRVTLVNNALAARDLVMILGEESQAGRPVPRPTVDQVSAWMDRNGLMPMESNRGIAAATVSHLDRTLNPNAAADTIIGGMSDNAPPDASGGTTADLPAPAPDSPPSYIQPSELGPVNHITDMVTRVAESTGILQVTDTSVNEVLEFSNDTNFSTTFIGKLPQEVLDIIARNPETRPLFSVAKEGSKEARGATGEESLATHGDQYESMVLELAQSDYKRSIRAFGKDPTFSLLDHVRTLWLGERSLANESNKSVIWARRVVQQVKVGRRGIVKDSVVRAEIENLAAFKNDPKKYMAEKKAIYKRNKKRVTESDYARAQEIAASGKTKNLAADNVDTSTLPEGAEFTIAGERGEIVNGTVDGVQGLVVRLTSKDGYQRVALANLPGTLPIDKGSLFIEGPRKMKKRNRWLAKKAEQDEIVNNAAEFNAFMERERIEREREYAEISEFIRQERESLPPGQDPGYDSGNDPAFASIYEFSVPEATPPVISKKDDRVFDPSGIVGKPINRWLGMANIASRATRLRNTKSRLSMDTSAMLFDLPLIDVEGGPVNASSGEMFVKHKHNAIYGEFLSKVNAAWDGYKAAQKIPLTKREAARNEFGREVGKLASMSDPIADPHLKAAVEATRKAIKDSYDIAVANGVDLPPFDPKYYTRAWSAGRKATILKMMEDRGVPIADRIPIIEKLLSEAVHKERPDLSVEEADALGRLYVKRIDDVSAKSALERMRSMTNLESFDKIKNDLTALEVDGGAGMDDAAATALAAKLMGSPIHGARPNVKAARSWLLDDRHSKTVALPDGTSIEISVADLMETDAGTVVNHYSRSLVAEGMMQQTLRTLSDRYKKSISSAESLLNEIDKEYRADPTMSEGARLRNIRRLQTGIALIKGLPTHETTSLTQTAQAATKFNYIRAQAGFAISATFEVAGAASRVSFAAMLKTVPIAREVYKQIKTGKVDGAVARAILSLGSGQEGLIRAYLPEIEARDPSKGRGGRFLAAANHRLGQGQTFVSRVTFFEQINTFSQVWARAMYMQHLADMARRGQSPSGKRLAGIGISEADWKVVSADIAKNAKPSSGAGIHQFDIDLDAMDPLSRTKYLSMVDAKSRQLIQEPTIGGSDYWLETPGARVVLQFRQFMIQALEKQLLTNVQQMDGESAAFFATAYGLGTLQYALMSYLDTRGADDPKGELEKRLTPARLGYGGFTRAAFSSIIPTGIDTGLQAFGYKPYQGRSTTGRASYSILDNPTAQLATEGIPSVLKLLRAGVDPTYDVSEQDLRGARSMIPLNRFPGVSAISNSLIRSADVPKKPQKEATDLMKILDELTGYP